MRTLELTKHRRARIWLSELPIAGFPAIETLQRDFQAEKRSVFNISKKVSAIEVYVPLGGRFMYGLLGGKLREDDSDKYTVDVNISQPNGKEFENPISGNAMSAYVGLPSEYVDAIFTGVDFAKKRSDKFFGGKLSIDHAAYSKVGSSSILFANLAVILINLLNMNNTGASNEDLIKLFPENFSSFRE